MTKTLLNDEQFVMRALPEQTFEACRLKQAQADSLSQVSFDRNSYSVPTKFAYREMTIVATVDDVRLILGHGFQESLCWTLG